MDASFPLIASARLAILVASLSVAHATEDVRYGHVVDVKSAQVNDVDASLLLGTHSLWFDFPRKYWEGRDSLVSVFQRATNGIIRFGGGVNEAEWSVCGNPFVDRKRAKVVDWAGPLLCEFGWDEYLDVALRGEQGYVWFVANVVGQDGIQYDDEVMRGKVQQAADRLRTLAPFANRIWELGNELERGNVRWGASQISRRLVLAGKAIREVDPNATLVAPLTEFDPSPITSRAAFNSSLLQGYGRSFKEFSVHQYYDGAPGGPKVSTQLMNLRDIVRQVSSFVPGGSVWITEHGRWPEGMPSNPGWKDNWWQTNSLGGVISTADYLIGISQIPQVNGAMLHGLRAGPWNVMTFTHGNASLTGVGHLLSIFSQIEGKKRLVTELSGGRFPSGWSSYDARVAALSTAEKDRVAVWAVNRSSRPLFFRLKQDGRVRPWRIIKSLSLECISGEHDCPSEKLKVHEGDVNMLSAVYSSGEKAIVLPPHSVLAINLVWQ